MFSSTNKGGSQLSGDSIWQQYNGRGGVGSWKMVIYTELLPYPWKIKRTVICSLLQNLWISLVLHLPYSMQQTKGVERFFFHKITLTFVTDTGPHAITSLASPPTADKEAVSLWTEEPLQWSWNCCSTRCIRCLCPAKEVPLNKTYGVMRNHSNTYV